MFDPGAVAIFLKIDDLVLVCEIGVEDQGGRDREYGHRCRYDACLVSKGQSEATDDFRDECCCESQDQKWKTDGFSM